MNKLLFVLAIVLASCAGEPVRTKTKRVYTIKVNYLNSSIHAIPADTIIITSDIVPHIYVNRHGVSVLVAESIHNPEAVNVRSIEILDIQ